MSDRKKSCCNGELVCVACAAQMLGITAAMVKAQARAGLLPGMRCFGTRAWAFSLETVQQALWRRQENAKQGGLGLVVVEPTATRRPMALRQPQRMPIAA